MLFMALCAVVLVLIVALVVDILLDGPTRPTDQDARTRLYGLWINSRIIR